MVESLCTGSAQSHIASLYATVTGFRTQVSALDAKPCLNIAVRVEEEWDAMTKALAEAKLLLAVMHTVSTLCL